MPPHKNPINLTANDQLKLIRSDLDKVKWDLSGVKMHTRSHDEQFKLIRIEIREVNKDLKSLTKKFDQLIDVKLERWKSEIHSLIDRGFTKKARAHDEEIGVLNNRTTELRKKLEKLEEKVYKSN